ncbi:hypothetical protein [Amycolatopsis solani]|uniref:hypothetical protein n=2 Tax=Amycolatopsis solani TaxID=3028615 RepID=UPI00296F7853|nr:hypothetical protein [Amycolatopsis sp. MEP2-6]
MSKEQFDVAIGVVPPSTVDVEAVLDRERRRARVRRVANPWTAAAAGVAAVAVGAAVVFVPGGEPAPVLVPPAASKPPSENPCADPPFPPQTGAPIPETSAAASSRLTTVLTAAVQQRLAAGSTLGPHEHGVYPKGVAHGPLEFFHVFSAPVPFEGACSGGEDYFLSWATTAKGELKGNVMAVVTRIGGNATPSTECTPPPERTEGSCRRRTGPHGETIIESTFTQPGGPTVNESDVTKPDGTGIILQAENVAGDAKRGGAPDMPSPPLSLAQLTEIALDPGLTLYP